MTQPIPTPDNPFPSRPGPCSTPRLSAAERDRLINRACELHRQLGVVLAELAGDDDPMTYSRDDDEPLAALLPPGIEGVAYTGRNQRPTNSPARPGAQLPEASLGRATSGMGAAPLGGRAVPTWGGAS